MKPEEWMEGCVVLNPLLLIASWLPLLAALSAILLHLSEPSQPSKPNLSSPWEGNKGIERQAVALRGSKHQSLMGREESGGDCGRNNYGLLWPFLGSNPLLWWWARRIFLHYSQLLNAQKLNAKLSSNISNLVWGCFVWLIFWVGLQAIHPVW